LFFDSYGFGGVSGAVYVTWAYFILVGPRRTQQRHLRHAQIPHHARGYARFAYPFIARPRFFFNAHRVVLRKSSLDELPQLWCVLIGDMSLVGPRPALHNQQDLLDARTTAGVHVLLPGLTGWAQVNGRDEVPMEVKVGYDVEYLRRRSLLLDVKILFLTCWKVVMGKDVAH
jgi:O-antigen biosynthesis protein WbqP